MLAIFVKGKSSPCKSAKIKDMRSVFEKAFELLESNGFAFLFFSLLANVFFLTRHFAQQDQRWIVESLLRLDLSPLFSWDLLLEVGISFLTWALFQSAHMILMLERKAGINHSLEEAILKALSLFPRLVLILFLFALGLAAGFLFVLGWIFVMVVFWMFFPAFFMTEGNIRQAFMLSFQLVRGRFFSVLGLALLCFFINLAFQILLLLAGPPFTVLQMFVESFFVVPVTISMYDHLREEPQAIAVS